MGSLGSCKYLLMDTPTVIAHSSNWPERLKSRDWMTGGHFLQSSVALPLPKSFLQTPQNGPSIATSPISGSTWHVPPCTHAWPPADGHLYNLPKTSAAV